ncbi:MAG: TA system VapC family ribonuclease toxin [Roseiflexaceae bacterium]|nr:TA system VapC family ribonuclease toxin [Roseiflexaceae bacterium]
MTIFLLDVNVLLALSDPMHIHHDAAHRWFAILGKSGWATCPWTENGFVRIASHPNYPNRPGDPQQVITILRQLCSVPSHIFWPDDVTIREIIPPSAIITHNHVIDIYLLGLAMAHGGKLATFDRRIAHRNMPGGSAALELMSV